MNAPVIIVGAGRSGTNMLRDILVQLPGFGTWPCDEINYIWRHGNRDFETDCFTREMATPETAGFIRKQFERLASGKRLNQVIEKTCANSLRVGFVDQIFPNAKFIQIIRDGRDVAASASKRWSAKIDIGYLAKKAKFVPKSDLFYYASRYFSNRMHRFFSGQKRLSVWGPKFPGMYDAFANHPLQVGCGIQWQTCIRASTDELAELDPQRVFHLTYEDFTESPQPILKELTNFLGVELTPEEANKLTQNVSNKSVGAWKQALAPAIATEMHDIIGECLKEFGYE